ncbi:hypothetical protein V9T40_006238 [Parthenolecanium corni]|uniref:Uncharacterized protein n=1 Tax=Parthenolecanium corni TaxID=536013 RepID=A0AAN9TWH0_9HEMI
MDDSMKRQDGDYQKSVQDYLREGEEKVTSKLSQLKDAVYQRLENTYQMLTGDSYTCNDANLVDKNLSDPLVIGDVNQTLDFGSIKVAYKNVQFYSLQSAKTGDVTVNTRRKKATLTLKLENVGSNGSYQASNWISSAAGAYQINLFGDVTFDFINWYKIKGNKTEITDSKGNLKYNSNFLDSRYDNLPLIYRWWQKYLARHLLKPPIEDEIVDELKEKTSDLIIECIGKAQNVQNQHHDSVEKVMGEGIKTTIDGIQQDLSKYGDFSIELNSDNKEMVYKKLHARIASVKLNGIEKFYLANNQISRDNSDMIHSKMQLALNRPTATAVVSIQAAHDENAPFQKINVDFDMEQVMAELSLEKTRKSGLQLRSVQTNVNRIQPINADKFEDEVRDLIKERLADHMKGYVERGLRKFIEDKAVAIMSSGVLPPLQEKQSA